jgi:hypothetical protein
VSELSPKLLQLLAWLAQAHTQSLIIAAVLGALAGRGLRALLLLLADRERGWLLAGGRALTAAMLHWDRRALFVFAGSAALMVSGVFLRRFVLGRPLRLSPFGMLARATLLLFILLVGTLTLLHSGFLALTTDHPVLRIDVTGETRPQMVRWAVPDQPMQDQPLRAHRILLRAPDPAGAIVAETWLYGDQVAIKGRVLRLSPLLNVAGIPNQFELQFLHNGYFTAERHNLYPHRAQPLVPMGQLAVHPRWQPLRDWLLGRWEQRSQGKGADSRWAIRAATTESTYFPLVDGQGQPVHRTYELVLTPGGLTAR